MNRHSRPPRPVAAGTPLPRRQALSLGVLGLACLFDPLRSAAEVPKAAQPGPAPEKKKEVSVPDDLRASVDRAAPGPAHSAVVYADGVAILDRQRQLRVGQDDVATVLRLFREAGFEAMPAKGFGEGKKRFRRRASLRREGRTKEVIQLVDGEQSAELQKLVDGVFEVLAAKAATAVTAGSVTEGLGKVGRGELAPQCLTVVAVHKPELGRPGASDGWLLVVDEGTATASSFSKGGFVDPRALPLDRARLARLTEALAAARPEALPGNLYAPDYRDLTVEVLDRRKKVTARPFSGMSAGQHREEQATFDKAFAEVEALVGEARERGTKVAPPAAPARPEPAARPAAPAKPPAPQKPKTP